MKPSEYVDPQNPGEHKMINANLEEIKLKEQNWKLKDV